MKTTKEIFWESSLPGWNFRNFQDAKDSHQNSCQQYPLMVYLRKKRILDRTLKVSWNARDIQYNNMQPLRDHKYHLCVWKWIWNISCFLLKFYQRFQETNDQTVRRFSGTWVSYMVLHNLIKWSVIMLLCS
jgi:hypothetical protein